MVAIKYKDFILQLIERACCIVSYIYPILEINYYWAANVCLGSTPELALFYHRVLKKLALLYSENALLIFTSMLVIFLVCSRGTLRLSKFLRFNVIQAILITIICTIINSTFTVLPPIILQGFIGAIFSKFFFFGTIFLILFNIGHIIVGRYPRIPVLSEAAKLQVQRDLNF